MYEHSHSQTLKTFALLGFLQARLHQLLYLVSQAYLRNNNEEEEDCRTVLLKENVRFPTINNEGTYIFCIKVLESLSYSGMKDINTTVYFCFPNGNEHQVGYLYGCILP